MHMLHKQLCHNASRLQTVEMLRYRYIYNIQIHNSKISPAQASLDRIQGGQLAASSQHLKPLFRIYICILALFHSTSWPLVCRSALNVLLSNIRKGQCHAKLGSDCCCFSGCRFKAVIWKHSRQGLILRIWISMRNVYFMRDFPVLVPVLRPRLLRHLGVYRPRPYAEMQSRQRQWPGTIHKR